MSATIKSLLTGIVSLLVIGFWFVMLRPTVLGGIANYLIISGISMEPTYFDGDLVIVHQQDQYTVGDVIAYEITDYYVTEKYVIHRIVGGNAQDGFVTQGDNRDEIDPWHPRSPAILGTTFLHVPKLGDVFAFLQAEPWRMAAAAGGIMLLSIVRLGRHKDSQQSRRSRRTVIRQRRQKRHRHSTSAIFR
jgi:signal peptidase